MPEVQNVADGWQSFGKPNKNGSVIPAFDLHCVGSKLFAFEENFYEMPEVETHKYSIAVEGGQGAVLKYTEDAPVWVRFGFAGFNREPNTQEIYITHSDTIYALISSRVGQIKFSSLFRFDENTEEFEVEKLDVPEEAIGEEGTRIEVTVAENSTGETTKIIIVSAREGFKVFSLDFSDGSSKSIAHVGDVENGGPMVDKAIAAFRHGNDVYITFGGYGCGFIWNRDSIIKYNLETKTTEFIEIPGEYQDKPAFSYGPKSSWSSGLVWGFGTGTARKGMCDSEFVGESWRIVGLEDGSPKWQKEEGVFSSEEEGLIATDNTKKATIVVSKEKTSVIYHEIN